MLESRCAFCGLPMMAYEEVEIVHSAPAASKTAPLPAARLFGHSDCTRKRISALVAFKIERIGLSP
jgi:hypothetical protein